MNPRIMNHVLFRMYEHQTQWVGIGGFATLRALASQGVFYCRGHRTGDKKKITSNTDPLCRSLSKTSDPLECLKWAIWTQKQPIPCPCVAMLGMIRL